MLTERHLYRIPDDGEENGVTEFIMSVDEILETYEIKGLSLGDLQEKYVNMIDKHEEEKRELEEKYNSLNSSFNDLTEEISELRTELEDRELTTTNNNDSVSYFPFLVILIITVIIAFFIGKQSNKKEVE